MGFGGLGLEVGVLGLGFRVKGDLALVLGLQVLVFGLRV